MPNDENIFLPMVEEAFDCIISFIDAEYASLTLDYFKYRDEVGLINKLGLETTDKFRKLDEKQGELTYHFYRMNRELTMLYENTPPYFHKKIQSLIKHNVELLEEVTSKEQVTDSLKVSNLYKAHKFWDKSGEQAETPLARPESEKLNFELLSSEYFNDYMAALNKMVMYFKFEATIFLEKAEIAEEDEDGFVFPLDSSMKVFILNKRRFKNVLEYYNVVQEFPDKNHYKVVSYNKDETRYVWNGIGSSYKMETLAQFIKKLFHEDIISIPQKAPVARAFLHFFSLKNNDSAVKDLAIEIDNNGSIYRNYFNAIKNITT